MVVADVPEEVKVDLGAKVVDGLSGLPDLSKVPIVSSCPLCGPPRIEAAFL